MKSLGCPQGICHTLFSSSMDLETWKMYSTWQPSTFRKYESSGYQRTFQCDNYITQYVTFTRVRLENLCREDSLLLTYTLHGSASALKHIA